MQKNPNLKIIGRNRKIRKKLVLKTIKIEKMEENITEIEEMLKKSVRIEEITKKLVKIEKKRNYVRIKEIK